MRRSRPRATRVAWASCGRTCAPSALGRRRSSRTEHAPGEAGQVPHLFASATTWVTRLAAAQREHRLDAYLRVLDRYRLLIIDEVGSLPFDADAASLFFQLVNARYERHSLVVTSNKPSPHGGGLRRRRRGRRDARPARPSSSA
jgi:DNA replication protein DnaC